MTRKAISNVIAVVSTVGILCWRITDWYGGMVIFLLSYAVIIIPIVLLYVISFLATIGSVIRTGVKSNKVKVYCHGLLLFILLLFKIFQSDLFKSKRILSATLYDDLFQYTLIFRENGDCENEVHGMFGFKETFHGKYRFMGDTIVFEKLPYDNKNFIPDTILIDREKKAIFIARDKRGMFVVEPEWLNHFKIH